jgi:outer membrane protein assembly factor BamB
MLDGLAEFDENDAQRKAFVARPVWWSESHTLISTLRCKSLALLSHRSRSFRRLLMSCRGAPLAGLLLFLVAARLPAEDNWPAFRGGALAGVSESPTRPSTWDTKKNVLWQSEIPGRGWSSPVVWGERVFLTSVTSDGKVPVARKGLYIQDLKGQAQPGEHRWLVHCLDARTGKCLWQREAHKGPATATIHIKNSYATETPVTDGKRLYAYFGNLGLFCYDMDGKELWSKKWPAYKTRFGWGPAASPALHGDRVYILNDNEEKSFLVALDAATGKQLWEVSRDEGSNWSTPFVWVNDRRTEIVTAGTKRVRSYDTDGKLLWELSGMSIIAIPTPFARHGLLYVSSGYVVDPFLKPVYAIRPGASGDITLREGETSSKFIAWSIPQAGPYNPTPLVYGDYLYVLYDRGMLSCYEAKTGKPVYEKQRLGAGAFTASPWAYGGKVFCLSEDGDTFVIQAGRDFKVLGRNRLEEMTLATPALAHGCLFLRTESKLYCLRQAGE